MEVYKQRQHRNIQMRIVYFANHNNVGSDDTEGHIAHSLQKLGHEVVRVSERNPQNIPDSADWFLFHKGGANIQSALTRVKYKKVCWYFDKVWNDRVFWMMQMIPRVDLMCMTDKTWADQHPNKNIRIIRQGIGDRNVGRGRRDPKFEGRIVFLGSEYGERRLWVRELTKRYGANQFRAYNNVFNRDLYDLCETVPIIVAPEYPGDENYWSSRIYMVLGSGGFLIHPRFEGLKEEYKDGVHYVGYRGMDEMFEKIDQYLKDEKSREKIRLAGYKKTIKDFTYSARVEALVKELEKSL